MTDLKPFPKVDAKWMAALALAAVGGSWFFACVTPFAVFAVIAVGTLPLGAALSTMLMIWLANQIVGYGLLDYPWTLDSALWGGAIGGAALSATLATFLAHRMIHLQTAWLRSLALLTIAFTAYEAILFGYSVVVEETAAFDPSTVSILALVHLAWLFGWMVLERVLIWLSAERSAKAGFRFSTAV